jgi:hypothetical protein
MSLRTALAVSIHVLQILFQLRPYIESVWTVGLSGCGRVPSPSHPSFPRKRESTGSRRRRPARGGVAIHPDLVLDPKIWPGSSVPDESPSTSVSGMTPSSALVRRAASAVARTSVRTVRSTTVRPTCGASSTSTSPRTVPGRTPDSGPGVRSASPRKRGWQRWYKPGARPYRAWAPRPHRACWPRDEPARPSGSSTPGSSRAATARCAGCG